MTGKDDIAYWRGQIERHGPQAVQDRIPHLRKKNREPAERALAQHCQNILKSAKDRKELLDADANAIARGTKKWVGWGVVIALVTALVSAAALWL